MATFTGTGITAQLIDAGTNYFTVVIDGGTPTVVPTGSQTQTYTLATGLAAGQHTVVLTKRTESYVGVVQILGLQPQGGALVPSPEPFSRRIELVGDSITCGYGDLGIGPNCSWSASTEDETITYGALTANQLNAEATVIAYSGIGMYQNANGVTTNQMPVLFERTLADDATSQWGFTTPAPDVVVINLGTNDFANGDPGQAYVTAYVAFLRQVRGHYANATIICTTSPMLGSTNNAHAIEASYIQSAISQVSDPRVSFMDFAAQDQANGLGCDWHPSPKTHQLMATTLVAQVNSLTGW
jgi:lysophospholipase L1-like esterase